ncbi:MAG TPA: FAD-binding oxidoreductase [Pirellulaceae bacterium]|nr:FAD-binding oxidoreductase [Pirellulaceae bacterium]
MIGRRQLLRGAACGGLALSLNPLPDALAESDASGTLLNDVQSQLNRTRVRRIVQPATLAELESALDSARKEDLAISVAGGRHSMGAQQFGSGNLHLDMTAFNRVLHLDEERGLVTAEAGIQWPELIQELHRRQPVAEQPWTIREKQTGVDAVTLAGSLASNVHGRALASPPIVRDVESFELLDAEGRLQRCSRTENAELFSLAIGGYGLFGVMTQVRLRLVRRYKVRRRVEKIVVKDLLDWYQRRIGERFVFGDCQYSGDLSGAAEAHEGIFPCYQRVPLDTPLTERPRSFSRDDWAGLYRLMRTDKRRAFAEYAEHYLQTDGQVYWSDTHQLAGNFVGHRTAVDAREGTEMITEVYLRHDDLLPFFAKIRQDMAERKADIMYGTIRFIERDDETFLPWAKERSVCVVCNLHVRHTDEGIAKAQADFRQILSRVVEFGGSFYLTYHRWATAEQVAACYRRIRDFFRLKRKYDPHERLQSDWYRQYAAAFR